MKRLSLLLFAIILGLSSYGQKGCLSLPYDFQIAFRGNWDPHFEFARVSDVSSSTSPSNIIAINELGGANIEISHCAFENTNPCYVLGYIRAKITVYKHIHDPFGDYDKPYKYAIVQLNNIFYFDYPINGTHRYCEYYIPNSSWHLIENPIEG